MCTSPLTLACPGEAHIHDRVVGMLIIYCKCSSNPIFIAWSYHISSYPRTNSLVQLYKRGQHHLQFCYILRQAWYGEGAQLAWREHSEPAQHALLPLWISTCFQHAKKVHLLVPSVTYSSLAPVPPLVITLLCITQHGIYANNTIDIMLTWNSMHTY